MNLRWVDGIHHPLCSTRCVLHFGDGFEMNFSSILLSSRDLRALSSLIFVVRVLFLSSGPTPIHAPRPRPITHSVGIGTSDFGGDSVDVSTQGGPPQLDLSSFFQDLCPTGTSSPGGLQCLCYRQFGDDPLLLPALLLLGSLSVRVLLLATKWSTWRWQLTLGSSMLIKLCRRS